MSDRIYVGYLPLTPRDRRFVRFGVVLLLAMIAVAAFASAREQRSPGPGHWDIAKTTLVTGTARTDGAARIVSITDGKPTTWFVVLPGKHGASQALARFDGQPVTVEGYALTRNGERMLELVGDIKPATVPATSTADVNAPTTRQTASTAAIRGEIVDLKCYLGAMKPGDGRSHKACATLCILGGIPAALVTTADNGTARCLIIRTADGGPLPSNLVDRIGEPVEVSGRVEREGDFDWLIVDETSVRRAHAADRWRAMSLLLCSNGSAAATHAP